MTRCRSAGAFSWVSRVSSDLADIIQRRPREMATFLRAANGLSAEEMQRLADEARRLKKEDRG
jgi:hypothetical protein